MKNKVLFLTTASVLFLGCTKTIQINDRVETVSAYPIIYEESRVIYNEAPVPQIEPSITSRVINTNLSPLETSDKLQEGFNVMLLDVREANEIPQDGKISNSMLIPLGSLARNLRKLDKSKQIIVYCHTGNRSIEAVNLLRRHGFDAFNMLGGIAAWKKSHLAIVWK